MILSIWLLISSCVSPFSANSAIFVTIKPRPTDAENPSLIVPLIQHLP